MGSGTREEDKRADVMAWDGIMRPMRSMRRVMRSSGRSAFVAMLAAIATGFSGGPASADPLFLPAADQGSWLAADKELHFAGSLAIAASLRIEGRRRETALAMTFGIGLLKEAYDATLKPRRLRRGASWKDLVVDLAGAAAGVALLSAIDR